MRVEHAADAGRGPAARRFAKIHKILGRVALVLSLVGTVLGYVAAWTDEGIPRGTAIGLSVVGVFQFKHTIRGYRYIKLAQQAVGDLIERYVDAVHFPSGAE